MTKREKRNIAVWKDRIQNQLDKLPGIPVHNQETYTWLAGVEYAFKCALKWFEEEINE